MHDHPQTVPGIIRSTIGKPRPFWLVLVLSIVTFTIYYVLYHYFVADELRRSQRWDDEDNFNPTTYMWVYSALVALWAMGFVTGIIIFFASLSSFESPEQFFEMMEAGQSVFSPTFIIISNLISAMVHGFGIYTTYYFLKLNDHAAVKRGLPPLGATKPMIAYAVIATFSIISSIGDAIATTTLDANSASAAEVDGFMLGASLILGLFVLLFAIGALVLVLYFLWKQCELVNYVWLGYPDANGSYRPEPMQPYYPSTPQQSGGGLYRPHNQPPNPPPRNDPPPPFE